MASVLTDFGDGYGYGGYGDCYGGGYGYGYGDGCGYGGGSGSGGGYGHGHGVGYGFGYGSGSGYGGGYGVGYGDPVNLGVISSYSVILMRPFDIIKIGCQVRPLNEWRSEWQNLSKEYEITVNKDDVDRLIEKAIELTQVVN